MWPVHIHAQTMPDPRQVSPTSDLEQWFQSHANLTQCASELAVQPRYMLQWLASFNINFELQF